MTRKRFAGIQRMELIRILNTTTTIPADQVKKINKRIYRADFKLPESQRKDGYKAIYELCCKAYHQRIIAGEA